MKPMKKDRILLYGMFLSSLYDFKRSVQNNNTNTDKRFVVSHRTDTCRTPDDKHEVVTAVQHTCILCAVQLIVFPKHFKMLT